MGYSGGAEVGESRYFYRSLAETVLFVCDCGGERVP